MTDDVTPEGAQGQPDPADADPPPISPDAPWQTGTRVEQLATWMQPIRSRFTDAALERSAIAGGFTAEEVREALALAEVRQRQDEAIVPVRSTAKRIVLGAYGLVWILFAIPYLLRPTEWIRPHPPGDPHVLAAARAPAVVPDHARPAPGPGTRVRRALTILLVMPVIVLLGISGLCLPFVASSGQVL